MENFIKFRAKRIDGGGYVYGDLIQSPYDMPVIRVFENGSYTYNDYEIYPESVAIFVGYDASGNEVYEEVFS